MTGYSLSPNLCPSLGFWLPGSVARWRTGPRPRSGVWRGGCQNSYAYVKLNAAGETLFATYLPPRSSNFQGLSPLGNPIFAVSNSTFTNPSQRYEVVESQAAKNYLGCFVDAGGFSISDEVAPGEIVTLFGRGLEPPDGVPFTLANGKLPGRFRSADVRRSLENRGAY